MNYSLKARAFILCLLVLYTYVVVPALAADLTEPDQLAQKDTGGKAPPATPPKASPPLKLIPPPPAESPSPVPPVSTDADQPPSTRPTYTAPSGTPVAGIPNQSYILGPGDLLQVADYSSSDNALPIVSASIPILPDGTINIHPIGITKAAGLSLGQFTEFVNKTAERYIIKPDLDISVIRTRPNNVYILGEVGKPGLYTNEAGVLLGSENVIAPSAALTVITALQKAGGIRPTADVRNIRVTRMGATEPLRCNLWQLIVEGDVSQDLGLLPGDVVYVPKGGADYDADVLGLTADLKRRIRIWGAVKGPGLYDMDPADDILSAISKAGGFTTTATRSWILLSRINRDGTVTTRKISMKRGVNDPDSVARTHLRQGDLIVVHDSLLKKGFATAYTGGVYFGYALILITYSLLLGNAITNSSGSGSSSSTSSTSTIPVVAPGAGVTTTTP